MDADIRGCPVQLEARLADDELVLEGTPSSLAFRVDGETHWAELHLENRVMAVPALWRRSETQHVSRLDLGQYPLERHRRDVMALVDDHVPVGGNHVVNLALPSEALDHRHVQRAVRLSFPTSDPTDVLFVDAKKHAKLGNPLVEQRPPVHEDEGAAASLGDEVRSQDSLADSGRRDEDASVFLEKNLGCLLLDRRERSVESDPQGLAQMALVIDDESHAIVPEKIFKVAAASSWQCDVCWQFLGAGDHAWGCSRRGSHRLLLVELWILEGGKALDPVQEGRRKPCLVDEQTLREYCAHAAWQRPWDVRVSGPSRR